MARPLIGIAGNPMKDFAPVIALPCLASVVTDNMTFWERMAEKWGIGLVGMALFFFLARWTARREAADRVARDKKDAADLAARDKKDAEDREERRALMARNNELQETLIAAVNANARKFEAVAKDGIRATEDHANAVKNLVRKIRCTEQAACPSLPLSPLP